MNTMPIVNHGAELALTGNFQSYLNYVQTLPRLSDEEEKALFKRYQEQNDLEAARKIILSHLRFVVHIARGYKGYGLPVEDMVQEGNIGLMKSVPKFDLSYGCRLASFAIHYIKAEIHEYILNNWRLVKVATTKAKRKLFFNLRKMKKRIGWLSNDEASVVAQQLNVDKQDVLEMEERLQQNDCFFDEGFSDRFDEDYDGQNAKSTYLEDHSMAPHLDVEHEDYLQKHTTLLNKALAKLDDRSRDIVTSRWLASHGDKLKLEDLGKRYGISSERVRQIEEQALYKMRRVMSHA
jgi:RNA polymerase sigma-32 factor